MNKLITRTVTPDIPVLVAYESTAYCKTFGNIILEMIEWGGAQEDDCREVIFSKDKTVGFGAPVLS